MKLAALNYETNIKQMYREKTVTFPRTFSSAILLPGANCGCLEYYLENGYITRDTQLMLVEKESSAMDSIKHKVKKHGLRNVEYHHGSLDTTPTRFAYDFANLDTCSTLSQGILEWLSNQVFTPGAEVNVWLTCFRGRGSILTGLMKKYLYSPSNVILELKQALVEPLMESKCETPQIVTAAALFDSLGHYNCMVLPFIKYTQHINPMYLYRFVDLFPRCNDVNDLNIPNEDYVADRGGKRSSSSISNLLHSRMCIAASDPKCERGVRAYVKRVLRRAIHDKGIIGTDEKWIKAGWKAAVTRQVNTYVRDLAHSYIDSI